MHIMIEYLAKDSRSGIYRYRRRVPKDLVGAIGKKMWDVSLRTGDERDALKRYPAVHAEIESQIARLDGSDAEHLQYVETMRIMKRLGLLRPGASEAPRPSDDPEYQKRFVKALRQEYQKEYDKNRDKPMFARKLNPETLALDRAMCGVKRPEVTLDQAAKHYLNEQCDPHNVERLRQEVRRVTDALKRVVRLGNPPLVDITADDAFALRDLWLREGAKASTVQRRINTIRALFNLAIKRYDLDQKNPFSAVTVKGANAKAKDKRAALTVAQIAAVNEAVENINEEARDIWHLLVLTGARLGEVASLEVQDIYLDGPIPFIYIRSNSIWRLKTEGSERRVPVCGIGVAILRRRLEAAEASSNAPIFPRYGRRRGSDTLSAVLSKAMKAAGVWESRRVVPYSVRHAHIDWCRRVMTEHLSDLIHGHSDGSISRNYGSDHMLDILATELEKALRKAGLETLGYFGPVNVVSGSTSEVAA